MREKNSRKLWSRISKLVAVTLALVLIVGVLPAGAASKEIVVKTKKQLVKAMESKSAATIIFRTNRKTRFIIPEIANSANKKLVMEAPNARAFNKATFKTITLNKSEYFNERGNDNSLYVKGDGVKLTVSKGIEAKKVSITATDVIIKVASNGNVGDIVCNKKEADITIAVAKNAEANITVKKKADLTVTGAKSADITVVAQAADTKITATAPVDIVAEKNVNVILEKGSEGSSIDSSKDVDVDISGAAEKQATVKEDGETVQEPEKTEEKKEEKKEEEKKDSTPATTTEPSNTSPTPSESGGAAVDPGKTKYGVTIIINDSSLGTVTATCGGIAFTSGDKAEKDSVILITVAPKDRDIYAVINASDPSEARDIGDNQCQVTILGETRISVNFTRAQSNYVAVVTGGAITLDVGNNIVATGASVSIVYKDTSDDAIKLKTPLNPDGSIKNTEWDRTSSRNEIVAVDFSGFDTDAEKELLDRYLGNYLTNLFPRAKDIKLPSGVTPPGGFNDVRFTTKIPKM